MCTDCHIGGGVCHHGPMRKYRSESDRRISGDVVRGLYLHGMSRAQLAERVGLTRVQLVNRIEGRTPWGAAEAERTLEVLKLPRLDSNQQPAGYGVPAA